MPLSTADVSFNISTHTVGAAKCMGGAMGVALTSQDATQPSIVTGVYITQAFGNNNGTGQLSYNPTTQALTWRPPGSLSNYTLAGITTSGSKTISSPEGTLVVSVNVGSLPTTYKAEAIVISSPVGAVFDMVNPNMSLVGDVSYRCLYFKNMHATLTASDLRLYIHTQPNAPQSIAIGLDPAGVGDGITTGVAQTITNTHNAPTGVVFSAPAAAANGLSLGTLGPGKAVAVWQRRTVPPMSYGSLTIHKATLGIVLVG